jgi:uncharacterized protein (TIGR04255 family)
VIAEALCEVHFDLPIEKPWNASLFGEFYKIVQSEYPEMEPLQGVGLQLEIGPQGLGQRLVPPPQRMRFRHAERPLLLQLDATTLIVNILAPYPGWDTVVGDVMSAWNRLRQVLSPSAITRVGLRYINRIERSSAEERPGEWIRPNEHVASGVLGSSAGFLSRAEVSSSEHDTVIVTLGDQPDESTDGWGAIIFDIDRISQRQLSPREANLRQEVDRLHEEVWQIFASAKSEQLDAVLQGTSYE